MKPRAHEFASQQEMSGAIAVRLLFAASAVAFAQSGVISGTVVETGGDPVRKAIVTLTWQGTPRSWATQQTDGSGRFKFEGLPAGKYDLRAMKGGAGTAIYGASSIRELGDLIPLEDGETRADLKLRFIHFSVLSGRVLDPDGDPLPAANVQLLRASRNLGERVLTTYRGTNSNDRGEYRFSNVEPGQYYLHVMFQGGNPIRFESQYFGGAPQFKDAPPVTVRTAENLTGLDFRLAPATVVRVSGRVIGFPPTPPSGRPGEHGEDGAQQSVQIVLSPADQGVAQFGQSGAGAAGDGKFQMPEVVTGRYRIEAFANVGGRSYSAWQTIDVQPGMSDVTLTLSPAVSLKGQVVIEGKSDQKLSSFQVQFVSGRNSRQDTPVGADGSFSVDQLAVGEWQMDVIPPPRGGYLKSVHLGDKDVRFARIAIEPGVSGPLRIVISMHTASIEGSVDSKRAGILLAPVGAFHDLARFYYGVATDAAGKFKMMGIAPGKYRVYALEKMAVASFRSPEAADQLGDLGEEVELTEGATVTVHPKLIPAERAREALP